MVCRYGPEYEDVQILWRNRGPPKLHRPVARIYAQPRIRDPIAHQGRVREGDEMKRHDWFDWLLMTMAVPVVVLISIIVAPMALVYMGINKIRGDDE